jgi:beta-hydroxylase
MFSILSPGKHIPPHRGAYNGLLRYHLGLKVPEPHEKCRIRIANQTTVWREGQSLVFDDTFNHEVWNDTDGVRVVLFVDFLRPMKKPYDAINRSLVQLGSLTPQMRKANRQQQEWTKQFYRNR